MTEKLSIESRFRFIEDQYKEILEKIAEAAVKSGRSPSDVRFMAVTKTHEPVLINHALSLGVDLIGENKVQELLGKLEYLSPPDVEKHLIGHLQSNKVRKIVGVVSMIQSVDSVSLLQEIERQSALKGLTTDVLLEVNIGAESAKTGLSPDSVFETAFSVEELPHVRLRGLMAVPPICETEAEIRGYFAKMRRIYEDVKALALPTAAIDTLSLGMSQDYVPAILEGSTLVRVGSALFGMRRY